MLGPVRQRASAAEAVEADFIIEGLRGVFVNGADAH